MFWKEKKEEPKGKLLKNLALIGGTAALAGFLVNKIRLADPEEIGQGDQYHELDLSRKARRYFLVYQNTDFEEESSQGYIWAPQETDSGRTIFHWDNLRRVRKDDLVFSVVDRKIVSLNRAKDQWREYEKDGLLGYRVDLDYGPLEEEIDVDTYMGKILDLSPDKYAPFNVMGRSNSGYLFDIGDKLGEYLLDLVDGKDKA